MFHRNLKFFAHGNSDINKNSKLRFLSVYETPTRFYIIGSNLSKSRYRLLKIDRLELHDLNVGEVKEDYSKNDIMELLATISEGNSIVYKSQSKKHSAGIERRKGLIERVSDAYALLGAVRFLEGYHLLIVTKARVVATIGYHDLFKIEEVALISLQHEFALSPNQDEQRYLKLFQSVDLTTNFYFSYTYNLSRTLQENVLHRRGWPNCTNANVSSSQQYERSLESDPKFVWNSFLLEPLKTHAISASWMVEIVHGYIGQQIIELPCSRLSLVLIGRRSSEFAGTRYLKRGANCKGQVANDVETEQIIWDTRSSPNFLLGKFSAFVQRRGSVPLIWSQDPSTRGVVGKPVISIDINEPHAQTAAAHLRELRKRYGSPLIIMNLVKRREKRKHEAILHDQFLKAVNYLNLFLPIAERIAYLSFDVARCHKTGSVLSKLEEIGYRVLIRHGWFQSFPPLYCHKLKPETLWNQLEFTPDQCARFILQRGVSRTNCVDCLDRTNVAQFGIGKVALGVQLYALGVVGDCLLSPTSEVCRTFEDLMDEHGDTLALQYAGSQLVHSIKTYKKISLIQERSRDVLQTLSRYYSNTFGDYDKQNAINIFLGIFRPCAANCHLWELENDRCLHFPPNFKLKMDYCAWFIGNGEGDKETDNPMDRESVTTSDTDQANHTGDQRGQGASITHRSSSIEDLFYEHYRLWEITKLEDLIREQRDLQKSVTVDSVNQSVAQGYSFAKLWKQDISERGTLAVKQEKPTMMSDDDDEEDEPLVKSDTEAHYECGFTNINKQRISSPQSRDFSSGVRKTGKTLNTGLLSTQEVYGFELKMPSATDMAKYERYAQVGSGIPHTENDWQTNKRKRLTDVFDNTVCDYHRLKPLSFFTLDSAFSVYPLTSSKASLKVYIESVECARRGPKAPSKYDQQLYERYSSDRFRSLQSVITSN